MEYSDAFKIVQDVLAEIGSTVKENDYDGLIVKKLEASNTLDANRTTKQSHIAITGAQMDMFPYVRADGYFEVDYDKEDSELKKYFVAQIPAYLHKENVAHLAEDELIFEEQQRLVHVSIVRSRRNNAADQIQMSMTYMDSPEYVAFRKIVHAGSYMIMLKRAKKLEYDIFCVKSNNTRYGDSDLKDINNGFFKLPTNTVVHLDEIMVSESRDDVNIDVEDNEYRRAANTIKKFIEETGFESPISREDFEENRRLFIEKFSPEKLAALGDDELLDAIFYTSGDNTESLCCWIEMNKDCRKAFGSIAGGSAFKFGLFQKKETGVWTTGSPNTPQELSDEDALVLGKEIRDALVRGTEVIKNAQLDTLADYEKLDDDLKAAVGSKFYDWGWFHKYYSIIYPECLSSFHSTDWQKHALRCFLIQPSEKYYARSGQLAMIQNYGELYYTQFIHALIERFSGIIQFLRLGTSDDDKCYVADWKKKSVVGIGWSAIGSLEEYTAGASLDRNEIARRLSEEYYPDDARTASRKAGELVRFYDTNTDTVFVPMEGERLYGLVDEIGNYFYDGTSNMSSLKTGKWHLVFNENDRMPEKGEGLLTSCVQLKNDKNLLYLYEKYYYAPEILDEEDEEVMEENQLKNCLEIEREPRSVKTHPMNVIVYGAPGTGKTYSTAEYALAIVENRPVDKRKKNPAERKQVMKAYNELIKKGQVVFTTFHQSYGYEEFIQGLRPDTKSDKMAFKTVDGVFKQIADLALNDAENNYVIIIDEINRANISKVFGELITLIEDDKRWGEVNETCATLQSGDVFAVPNNLYIVGTMNSADKSISLIDAALRRRFEFVEQKPEADLIDDTMLKGVLEKLNLILADELESADLLIGHSYFLGKTVDNLPMIMNNSIIPLLYEYFYDNKKKVASVLKDTLDGLGMEIVDDKIGRLSVKKAE